MHTGRMDRECEFKATDQDAKMQNSHFIVPGRRITLCTLVRDRGFLLLPVLPTVPGGHPPAAPAPLCDPSSFAGADNCSSRIGDRRCSFMGGGGGL